MGVSAISPSSSRKAKNPRRMETYCARVAGFAVAQRSRKSRQSLA
jgi:hypothetical protein